MFNNSTQCKHWMFANDVDINNTRSNVNANFIASRKQLLGDEINNIDFLSSGEERLLLLHYESTLKVFCQKFQPPMPRYVTGTALHYLKRFYVNNSVMDYPPKEILITCVYLACKVEEFNVSMNQFVSNLNGDKERAAAIILNNELLLMQQLDYQLTIYNPFRPLEGLLIDMKTRFTSFKDPERLRPGIDEFLDQVYFTDAILIYAPSQIALAAIINSASISKENVDHYITDILFGKEIELLGNLIKAVKEIRVMVRNLQLPNRETIKVLESKLQICCNPDNNSSSAAFKKRMKQSFEDEEMYEDGHYSKSSVEQVREVLTGLSEISKH